MWCISVILRDEEEVYIANVVEWSRALDIKLSDWCYSVSMVWVQIPSREEQKFDSSKSNSNTVWFNFQTCSVYVKPKLNCGLEWLFIENKQVTRTLIRANEHFHHCSGGHFKIFPLYKVNTEGDFLRRRKETCYLIWD